MKTKLWQTEAAPGLHPLVETYTVGDDYHCDQRLLGYDIRATKAHVTMLQAVGVLTQTELDQLLASLDELSAAWQAGAFRVEPEQEDGHTAIEQYLVEQLGPVGRKVHTARSRNDQALVMLRLYLKDSLKEVAALVAALSKAYTAAAKRAGNTPMPGYTHTQKAMPTTVALWLESFAAGFDDSRGLLAATRNVIDQNPLGSAAGFGVPLRIDRSITTKQLRFRKTQENPMYCGLSRGLFELLAVQALNPLMVLAGKFAQDMLLFTTQEFGFFSLPETLTTGSSIMPHKRNYDLFEIMRGQAHSFGASVQQLQALAGGTGSGYHRDLQLTKAVTLQAFDTTIETLRVLTLAVRQLQLNRPALQRAMTGELESVAAINALVEKGVPFREAYQQVKAQLICYTKDHEN